MPAYGAFADFIAADYAPHGRTTLSVASLPDGKQRYLNDIRSRTTVSNLTPEQIHEIGLKEIERIQADMVSIARRQGFADLASFRESLKNQPSSTNPPPPTKSSTSSAATSRRCSPRCRSCLLFIPGSPVTVEAMPDFQAANATHYQTGTPDGKRPGRVVVAVSNFADRSLIDDEATAYHEGIPGHHMQQSVAQQLVGSAQISPA